MPGRGDEPLLRADVPGIHVLSATKAGRGWPGHDGNEGKGKRARSNFFNRIKLIWAVQSYLQK